MDEGTEAEVGLVVAGGDAAEMLEFVDEAFDHVALAVEMPVVADDTRPGRVRRDHGFRAKCGDGGADAVGIVGLVGDHVLGPLAFEQRLGLRGVLWGAGSPQPRRVRLAGREDEPDELAERVDEQMDFAAQAAPRAANRLITKVFFEPAAC
jgi:hypothetical protein